jgi:ribosomal protein S27AE
MLNEPNIPVKECPECGEAMAFSSDDFLYYCTISDCGFTEVCEDGNPPEEVGEIEDEEAYFCPHCGKQIDEDELP